MPLPTDLSAIHAIHMTGIKGTGMAALAEVLHSRGIRITGSDVAERFYTDELLENIGIRPQVGFDPSHLPLAFDLLVYSAAYDEDNPERRRAAERGIPQRSYTEVLGAISEASRSVAVSGVHGKTSTTAMMGMIVSAGRYPATVIVGSAVQGFGNSATLIGGNELLIAETCEYRRHFLQFSPDLLLITSVEADHLDYFRDRRDVEDAFYEFGLRLPKGGSLVYCADDAGATQVARRLLADRDDISSVPYGFTAKGVGETHVHSGEPGIQRFTLGLTHDTVWTLNVPGRHMVQNAAGAIVALAHASNRDAVVSPGEQERWVDGLASFTGTRRRSEIIDVIDDILIVDDYAHHPTAIRKTLEGYREFWSGRRIVVDFMSHTYSRSEALLDEFVTAFESADLVYVNDIYSSAREAYHGGMTGKDFAAAIGEHHRSVRFVPDFEVAAHDIVGELHEGDLFVTMGAGDNFRIGIRVAELLKGAHDDS